MQRPQDRRPQSKPDFDTRVKSSQNQPLTQKNSSNSTPPIPGISSSSVIPPDKGLLSATQVVLPLRLFLGVSFVAAGLDKLSDSQFLDPTAGGYIGAQLTSFATHSPLKAILTNLAIPNATFFGIVIMLGELAIGLGTLLGLFTRTAAFFGLVLSLILWLTASWEVTPFFLGSDLPYAMGWLILLLAGAHPVFSLDGQLQKQKAQNSAFKGVEVVQSWNQPLPMKATNSPEPLDIARRRFLVLTGSLIVAGMATGIAWAKTWHDQNEAGSGVGSNISTSATPQADTPQPTSSSNSSSNSTAPSGASSTSPAPAQTGSNNTTQPASPTNNPSTAAPAINGKVLAPLSSLAIGNARSFTTPDTGEPAILIRQPDGSVKAFSAICTHEGCEVQYVKSAQVLVCPCHGAQFNAQTGQVLRRPARSPLQSFKIQVDGSGNIIYVQGQ